MSHRHLWFIIEVVTCVAPIQDINKDKISINLETSGNSNSKYGILAKKLKIGIFFTATLCHSDCHTGTGTTLGVLKMETRVQRTHTKFIRAPVRLNWVCLGCQGSQGTGIMDEA